MASATQMMSGVDEIMAGPNIPKLNELGMSLKEKLEEVKVFDSEILALVKDEELEEMRLPRLIYSRNKSTPPSYG